MYTHYPPEPYNPKLIQSEREIFLEAVSEMNEDTQNFIRSWIEKLTLSIMEKQQDHFKNMNAAHNDAVLAISRIIWKAGE